MLFKEKPEEELRSKPTVIRWTKDELGNVQRLAKLRGLSVTEFIRRAALGRKAEVRYEDQIILELREVTKIIRDMYQAYVEHGMEPPEETKELFRSLVEEAKRAMLRVSL